MSSLTAGSAGSDRSNGDQFIESSLDAINQPSSALPSTPVLQCNERRRQSRWGSGSNRLSAVETPQVNSPVQRTGIKPMHQFSPIKALLGFVQAHCIDVLVKLGFMLEMAHLDYHAHCKESDVLVKLGFMLEMAHLDYHAHCKESDVLVKLGFMLEVAHLDCHAHCGESGQFGCAIAGDGTASGRWAQRSRGERGLSVAIKHSEIIINYIPYSYNQHQSVEKHADI
ncbi:hypothetical protein UY3_07826 [Chelonia mydas]|uniref:Uncharacterized protein n=1 Tax=Chelonia mydas TaxID=8469 RepID=M7BSD9_CHEMY|nr:hypothetical protein UY3_07826 [Chelonia mydas]